jgi:ketosteroid isomerase-like protein
MPMTKQEIADGLTQVGKRWDEAMVANDVAEIGKFMSDGWVIVGTEGGITSKENFLAHIKSGDLIHTTMDFEDARVEVYDKTGVVTSKGTSGGTYKGEPFSYYEWSTNVYIMQKGQWLCVLTMLTPAQKEPA